MVLAVFPLHMMIYQRTMKTLFLQNLHITLLYFSNVDLNNIASNRTIDNIVKLSRIHLGVDFRKIIACTYF